MKGRWRCVQGVSEEDGLNGSKGGVSVDRNRLEQVIAVLGEDVKLNSWLRDVKTD